MFIVNMCSIFPREFDIANKNETYFGVTNIGTRPTFGEDEFRAETWIMDFEGELYRETIEIWPLKSLRAEKKF